MAFRYIFCVLACAVVAACQPAVPDSAAGVADPGRGVGFGGIGGIGGAPDPEQQRRDAALEQSAPLAPDPVTVTSVPTPTFPPRVDAADQAANEAARAANSGVAPVEASPTNAPPPILNNPGISDEQDFSAVSSRETIESDAARIEANRQQYEVVQPTALPDRSGSGDVNIVAYALQTRHSRGTRVYNRVNLRGQARHQRVCAGYSSADLAQIDFLESGGPNRDRKGLDPDGDGYACSWDPAPFRRAAASG